MSHKIFISYRHDDSAMATGRLFEQLAKHFPRESMFMDVDALVPGAKFVDVLKQSVAQCDTFIAMIGPNWSRNSDGIELFENPNDFVRIEVTAALERDIRIIPVLLEGVTMPKADDLPADMKALVHRHAISLRHARFNADADVIVSAVEMEKRPLLSGRVPIAASIGIVSLGALLGWFYVDGWKDRDPDAASPKSASVAPAADPLVDMGAPTASAPAPDIGTVPAKVSPADGDAVAAKMSSVNAGDQPATPPATDAGIATAARPAADTGVASGTDVPTDPGALRVGASSGVLPEDKLLLARFIFSEARNEDVDTWQAVANVVLNRVKDVKYPGDISGVVFQRQQFSFSNKRSRDYELVQNIKPGSDDLFDSIIEFTGQILSGDVADNTGGAVSYHLGRASPRWSRRLVFTKKIGSYKFYKHKEQAD